MISLCDEIAMIIVKLCSRVLYRDYPSTRAVTFSLTVWENRLLSPFDYSMLSELSVFSLGSSCDFRCILLTSEGVPKLRTIWGRSKCLCVCRFSDGSSWLDVSWDRVNPE